MKADDYLNEIWRDVKGFEGYYQASRNTGEIRSLDRHIVEIRRGKPVNVLHKGKIVKPYIDRNGRYNVHLWKNNKENDFYIHKLIVLTFPEICGEWFEGCECHHIDRNPLNNTPSNIIVLSKSEHHFLHSDERRLNPTCFKKGHTPWCKGKPNPKLTGKNNPKSIPVLVYTKDFEVVGCYDTGREAAKAIGCSPMQVSNVCRGKRDSCKGLYCEYL